MTSVPDNLLQFDLSRWTALSVADQRSAIHHVLAAGLDRELDLAGEVTTPDGWLTFTLRHRGTGILLQLIPGGSFERGLSKTEEGALVEELEAADDEDAAAALSRLGEVVQIARPVATVRVAAFLLAPVTLDGAALADLLGGEPDGLLPGCASLAAGDAVADALTAQQLRLPSEAEHEYAYRATTVGPFPWGQSRPKSPRVDTNQFGIEGIGEFSELCADGWHPSHVGAPVDGSAHEPERRPRTARGGSAEVWPWQGCGEWLAMLSAARSPSVEHDGFLRIRPARSLRVT